MVKSSTAAKVGMAGVVAGGIAAVKQLHDLGAEFDEAFNTIRVGTGATGKNLEGLKDDFKDVVSSVPTDFESASEAIAELNTRLGITGKPLRERSKQFLELSRITKSDVAENVKFVTRAFGDWEVATAKQGKMLDFFFRASQASGATVRELSDLVVQFGAPLRQVGFDIEEATAMFASFEKAGVNIQTMMPGLKFALKTFYKEGKDPQKALLETFTGIETGVIDTTEALEIFGQRAGADMVEAVEQGRFKIRDFTDEIAGGKDTIMAAGEEARTTSEQFQLLANKLKVRVEPAATAVYEAIGQFSGELATLNFTNPISGAVAFGAALGGVATAAMLARGAIAATWALAARHPFGALAIGVGLGVGALVGLMRSSDRAASSQDRLRNIMRRQREVFGGLSAATERLRRARRRDRQATKGVERAEAALAEARKKHGPNSQQALNAEVRLRREKQRSTNASRNLKDAERLHGVELRAAKRILPSLIRDQKARTVELHNEREALKEGLRVLLDMKAPVSDIQARQKQLSDKSREVGKANRALNETLQRASREVNPKFARSLERIANKTGNTKKGVGLLKTASDELRESLNKLPRRKQTVVDVKLNIGGIGFGSMGRGPQGSGWPLEEHIDAEVTKRVRGAAASDPLGALGAAAGVGGLGGGIPGHVSGFNPLATSFGLEETSGYRPGDDGYHGVNRARDYSNAGSPTPEMMSFARFMAAAFGPILRELIYTPLGFSIKDGARVPPYAAADHYDHVHVALQQGGVVTVPGHGTGDKVPAAFPEGSFVVNKVAAEMKGFQKGGLVKVLLEPGEKVMLPGDVARVGLGNLEAWNAEFPRHGTRKANASEGPAWEPAFKKRMNRLWHRAAPLLGQRGKAPDLHLMRGLTRATDGHVAEVRPFEDGSRGIFFDRGWGKQLLAGGQYAKQVLLHEWAHAFQKQGLAKWEAEGGATMFERFASKRLFGRTRDVRWPAGYKKYADAVLAKKGWPWIRRGQFLRRQKGGSVNWGKLVGSSWDNDELATLAHVVGMKNPGLMAQIAQGESSGNARAVGHDPGGTEGLGLWQITTGFNDELIARFGGRSAMFNPLRNAMAAKAILDRQGTGAWYAPPTGPRGDVDPNLAQAIRGGGRSAGRRRRGAGGASGGGARSKPEAGLGSGTAVTGIASLGENFPAGEFGVPKVLRGLSGGITQLFKTPGMDQGQRLAAAGTALQIAERTRDPEDERRIFQFQRGVNRARKRKAQKEIARLNRRLRNPRLGKKQRRQIRNKIGGWRTTLGEAQSGITSASEGLSGLDEGEAADPHLLAIEAQTEEIRKAREVEEAHTRMVEEQKAEMKALKEEMEQNRKIAESELATSAAVAKRALTDMLAGELGPQSLHASRTAGDGNIGTVART